jgi:hypothetical protein
MTRKSGFSVKGTTTGGEFRVEHVPSVVLDARGCYTITFLLPAGRDGEFVGFGLWFHSDRPVEVAVDAGAARVVNTTYGPSIWNKIGSVWRPTDVGDVRHVVVTFRAHGRTVLAIRQASCGVVEHNHLRDAREPLKRNMYLFAPEALFVSQPGEIDVQAAHAQRGPDVPLLLKSCNRCGRFLPINVPDERAQLSFTNHCVAASRRPCRHATFGNLRNVDKPGEALRLDYGFQLECRFCKKFEVNAAHNPQRTAGQMKEDAARRRGFELLIEALAGNQTPQLAYRHETGRDLATDVLDRFCHRCFKCGAPLEGRDWGLDHTRPLALLWPLDGTATALCNSCNSLKRDRAPGDFYTSDELRSLSQITGIPLDQLRTPQPNMAVVNALLQRLDWFFDTFLQSDDMTRERDGKITGELLVKALQKVLDRCPGVRADLVREYNRRRRRRG